MEIRIMLLLRLLVRWDAHRRAAFVVMGIREDVACNRPDLSRSLGAQRDRLFSERLLAVQRERSIRSA